MNILNFLSGHHHKQARMTERGLAFSVENAAEDKVSQLVWSAIMV